MKKEEQDLLRLKGILDEIGIPFFLIEGTLLGAVRDGTLIEYDHDFDIGTPEDVEDEAVRKIILDGFRKNGLRIELRGPNTNPRHPSYWFFIVGLRWPIALLPYIAIEEYAVFATVPIKFPLHLFHGLKEIEFLGERFLVPNPPEEYLECNYGKTWGISARRMTIEKSTDPIIVYEPPPLEKVYLRCERNGTLMRPLESIGPQLD